MRVIKNLIRPMAAVVALLAGLLAACGDGVRNDQGVAFTLVGFYQLGTLPPLASAQGVAGYIWPLSGFDFPDGARPRDEGGDSIAGNPEGGGTIGGAYIGQLGLQNHLDGQGIRLGRIHMDYYIPGANIDIPNSSWGVPGYLGPYTDNSDTDAIDSTLPDGIGTTGVGALPQELMTQVVLLPPEVRAFLNLQRTQLPEPPFQLIIGAYVTGVTTAGHDIQTNRMEVQALITPDNIIPPSQGEEGQGDGGDGAGIEEEFLDDEDVFVE